MLNVFLLSTYLSLHTDSALYSSEIMQHIHSMNPRGRFLEMNKETNLYYEVTEEKAREKVCQVSIAKCFSSYYFGLESLTLYAST